MSQAEAPVANAVRSSARSRYLALCGGVLLALTGLGWYLSDTRPPPEVLIPAQDIPIAQRSVPARHVRAETDRGRPVDIFWVADANGYLKAVQQTERDEIRIRQLRLIRTGLPDETYNCYGWVFTGGTYWLIETEIPRILEDNGYRQVEVPQAGDLVLYWDETGAIVHCGLVRVASPDGLILIESKWGEMGRFIHRPGDCTHDNRCTYYHSDRPGHVLRIRHLERAD
jgi:hypothetical protein